jgi:type II secretory pathway component PulK
MKIRLYPKSDGIALLIVMCAIFVLSILAAGLAFSMKVESKLAQSTDTNQRLVWLGRSGVEYCRWILAQEKCPYDSLNQQWAGGSGSECDNTNMAFANPVELGDGTFTWKIIDLERYANINTAPAPEIQQALTLMGVDAGQISVVSDSIQDWVQPGDAPRIAGAKTDYYLGLNPPYNCKEAPVDDLSELLLVKGIWDHPEIYWGGAATNHPGASFQHHLGFGNAGEVPNYPFGLVDIFTPFSSGKININTADVNVLQLIPGVDNNVANKIIQMRNGENGTGEPTPILNPAGALQSVGDQNPQAGNLVTTRSTTFKVTVTAQIGNYKRDFNAILFRPLGSRTVQVVSFYWNY